LFKTRVKEMKAEMVDANESSRIVFGEMTEEEIREKWNNGEKA